MSINSLETFRIPDQFASDKALRAIEQHLTYLKVNSKNYTHSMDLTYKYEGDFYGLLSELGYQPEYHYSIMRINDLVNPSDYKGTKNFILVPDIEMIDNIVTLS